MLDTLNDLVESYRLRYDVYRALGYLKQPLESSLEIDEYDTHAIPFGAFDLVTGSMIGTVRLITIEPQPGYDALVRRVVEDFGDDQLRDRVFVADRRPLPSMLSNEVNERVALCNAAGLPLRELSRGITHEDHRGGGVGRGLMELGIAHAMQDGPVFLVGGCIPDHLPMYAKYGYYKLPHSDLDHFEHVDQIANVMVCSTNEVPEPTSTHIHNLLHCIKTGAQDHTRELTPGSQAFYPIAAPPRARRRTMEW